MKKYLLSLTVLALSFMGWQRATAQNYQPFGKRLNYHFFNQDSIYSLWADFSYMRNSDSVFTFNKITKPLPLSTPLAPPCFPGTQARFDIYENNQFGKRMIKKTNGDFQFETVSGATFLLKPNAAIGVPWTFYGTLTAILTSKTYEPVLTVMDSVLLFTISNGHIIKLSKNYGFIQVPNFVSYQDSYFNPLQLSMYKFPKGDNKTNVTSAFKIYDFQPNDQFGFYYKYTNGTCIQEQWKFEKILTRNVAPDGKSITYTKEVRSLMASTSGPSPCGSGGTSSYGPGIYTTTISMWDDEMLNIPYKSYVTSTKTAANRGRIIKGIFKEPLFSNREVIMHQETFHNPCINVFVDIPSFYEYFNYATGLGMIEHKQLTTAYGNSHEKLECYVKGNEVFGNCSNFLQIISGKPESEQVKPALTIFPNPAENAATLKFDQPLTSGKLTVTVVNTMGQTALQQEFTEAPEQQINLNLEKLAKGIYVVQAAQNGKTFTTRFVKQ